MALLLLQRRPVAGRALLVTGSGCPSHSLCGSNVQEQTRRQVALLNATAQDLFSLYVSGTRGWWGPPGHAVAVETPGAVCMGMEGAGWGRWQQKLAQGRGKQGTRG